MNDARAIGMGKAGEVDEIVFNRRADDCKLTLLGRLVEIGRLEDESGADGMVIKRPNGECITIKGLTHSEVRAMAPHFMDIVAVRFFAQEGE